MRWLLFLIVLLTPVAQAAAFSDLQFSHYKHDIFTLADEGVITGYDDGTFRPRDTINRAEFLTMLLRDGERPKPRFSEPCFTDLEPGTWYVAWICAAENRGIINGYPDGTFVPTQPVNTVEAVKMITKLMDNSVTDGSGERWFEPYQDFLHDNDILSKFSYTPAQALTRERAADFITRMRRFVDGKQASRYSAGCGEPAPRTAPTSMILNDLTRTWIIDVPANYVSHKPVPLLFAWHGRTNPNTQVYGYYKFHREATEFITVYPQALPLGNAQSWADPGQWGYNIRDLELFDELVHYLGDTYCIDLFNIYAAGHSLGGWMSNALGCTRGDVIRATASVGSSGVQVECAGPAAALLIHNPNDNLATFSSGVVERDHRLAQNSCTWDFFPSSPSSLKCEIAEGCQEGQTVKWCPHEENYDFRGQYYPHTWPEDATKTIVDFFRGQIDF